MEEGKLIEGLSLSLAAGITAGTVLAAGFQILSYRHAAAGLSAVLCAAAACTVLYRREERKVRYPELAALFALAGLFCAVTDALPGGNGLTWALPQRAATALKDLIGRIAYGTDGTGALVSALVTGDRSGLRPATVAVFRESGASHLLALSGLHVGILYLIGTRLLGWTGNTPAARRFRSFALVGLAGFYAVMTGAAPSIVRAFLFIAINETCRLTGRKREPGKVLCLALTVQLSLTPSAVRSLGFQMSYLAMTGILLLYPRLAAWWPDGAKGGLRRIWNGAVLAVSCQAFTAPLAWLRFGTFPKYFLLTNLLAVPLTTALMALSLAVIVLTAAGCCPAFLVGLNDKAAQLLLNVLETIASM